MANDLETIRTWLSGTFSSRAQAMELPVWFIPVRLCYVPLDHLFETGVGFFAEQNSEHLPNVPYRSRILQLLADPLRLENYKFKDQKAWAGAAADPERLKTLTLSDLVHLPGCRILLTKEGETYRGEMAEAQGCRISETDASYVHIEFVLSATRFLTLDQGFNGETGAQTWGSRSGPYQYIKIEPDMSGELSP
jgi:CpeT protein